MSKGDLTLNTPDKNGLSPVSSMIGVRLQHTGNKKVYVITGFCWLGDSDEWGYLHSQIVRDDGLPGVTIARPFSHIYGKRSDGSPRYVISSEDQDRM